MDRDPWTRSMELCAVHAFFLRKINLEIWKTARALDFDKNTPKLFQNYILVTKNLHLGP
jgi:hypothetical protein